MRILLVEDDNMIGAVIQSALIESAYAVDWVKNGEDAVHSLACHQYNIVLLDLGLPRQSGLEALRLMRIQGQTTPVLIITAKDQTDDKIKGLDAGADDYLLKPFAMGELLARIRALLRRNHGQASPILSNGLISLDLSTREVFSLDQDRQTLSSKEFSLLEVLMLRSGTIFSRNELEERIYGWGYEVESNAIEFLIHSIRKKIGKESIQNIRGLGWRVKKGD